MEISYYYDDLLKLVEEDLKRNKGLVLTEEPEIRTDNGVDFVTAQVRNKEDD